MSQGQMRIRIAAISVIGLLTLSVIAAGFSALGETQDVTASGTSSAGAALPNDSDNTAVSAFKFVCPFH